MLKPTNRQRSIKGSMLVFIVAMIFILAMFGLLCFYMLGWLGGSSESLNATEAGNLNIGKQAIKKPAVALNSGVEKDNFSGLADKDGEVCLENYNRITGQMLIVAANAEAQGTSAASNNYRSALEAFQSGSSSISTRLRDKLNANDSSKEYFSTVAGSNSTRMVDNAPVKNDDNKFKAAYIDKESPTNVTLDPSILPDGVNLPSGVLSDKKGGDGKSYINGYKDITMGKLQAFSGAAVHPDEQPHLISRTTFDAAIKSPVKSVVPPNAFQSVADVKSSKTLINASWSTVGAQTAQKYQASIPHGFIVIYNPAGFRFQGHLPNPNSIFNNQLYTGVFLGSTGAFSTNRDALQAWADYNNANPKPGSVPSREGIFDRNGNPISAEDASKITGLGGNGLPIEVDYTMTSGEGAMPQVVALIPSMERAYNSTNEQTGSQPDLTAVEDLKGRVMMMFANRLTGTVNPPTGFSGMRAFDHKAQLPVPAGAPPIISKPGGIAELLSMAGDDIILPDLKKRIRQIKPSASESEIKSILTSKRIELGERWYIFLDEKTQALKMDKTPPSWITALPRDWQDGTKADGNPVESSAVFQTLGYSVNPPGEAGFNNALFDSNSDPSSTGLATDKAIWRPSCGFNNLLGSLQFRESIEGLGSTAPSQPPPPPTPPQAPPTAPPPQTPLTTPTTPTPPRATPAPVPPRTWAAAPTPTPAPPPAPKPQAPKPKPTCCNPTTCQFKWDNEKPGFNASINDIIALLRRNGASDNFVSYKWREPFTNAGSPNLTAMGYSAAQQANMAWDAAVAIYLGAGHATTGSHTFAGEDLPGYVAAKRKLLSEPGGGQNFLRWYNQMNCGHPLIIVNTIN